MHKISLLPINDSVSVRDGSPILPALLAKNLRILMSCGGNGICSTCHIRVRSGSDQLSPMEAKERRTLALVDGADATSRLACQAQVRGDGVVLELPAGMSIEAADDLLGLLGERAPENILHPIRGHLLIPKGKIITRTLLDQSRSIEGEVRRLRGGLLGLPEASPTTPASSAGFAATGRGMAPKTLRGVDPAVDGSATRKEMPAASVLVSVGLPTFARRSTGASAVDIPPIHDGIPIDKFAGSSADRPSGWDDRVDSGASTDTGMLRFSNQDSLAILRASGPEIWKTRGHLFLVADGMGGQAAGDIASKFASQSIPVKYHELSTLPPAEALLKAYRYADRLIHDHATAHPECRGMGTTCSTLVLSPEGALIAHVGDSRVYRIRREKIEQLSFDHSMAWELIRVGLVAPEKAKNSIARNVITRNLGQGSNPEVDIEGPLPVEPGDVFLLCSDGLSGHVEDPEIGLFASAAEPQDAARYLVALANLRGGRDNVTVLVARYGPEGSTGLATLDGQPGEVREKVPEHIYRSASCSIASGLLEGLAEQRKKSLEVAREQSWPVDWPGLEARCREVDQALDQDRPRDAVRFLGEIFDTLGTAASKRRRRAFPGSPAGSR